MPTPPQVVQWVKRTYPRPSVDLEWLDGCYSWIQGETNLNPAEKLDEILYNVETQLLQSDLSDSMLAGTGLPQNISELDNTKIPGPPILVEIVAVTEIGHSAFSLQNTRQARLERADLGGLAEEQENENAEEEGPVPKYPRSMLRFELSDGSTTLKAIEYRRLPELQLGETPLGFKMLLKNVFMRKGVAFLEPANVELKGYQTEDRQARADEDFARGLRERLGLEDDPQEENNAAPRAAPAPPQPAVNAAARAQAPASRNRAITPPPLAQPQPARSPLQEIDDPPEPGPSRTYHDEDEELPRRRKVPARQRTTSPEPPTRTAVRSRYFSEDPGVSKTSKADKGKQRLREIELAMAMRLSPARQSPVVVITDSEGEDDFTTGLASTTRKPPAFLGSKVPPVTVRKDSDVVAAEGKGKARQEDLSSDYDFDFEIDNDILDQIDKVEKEALNSQKTQLTKEEPMSQFPTSFATATTATLVAGSSVTPAPPSRRPAPKPPSSTTRPPPSTSRRPTTTRRTTPAPSQPPDDDDIILIDDDEDEKENVPVPTRRVRRRFGTPATSQVPPEDIIEISD